MPKSILVTGATGKQGSSVVRALLDDPDYTILAVTRNASSESATKLAAKGNNIVVVEGDLNDVPTLFANAQKAADGALWGVYSVQLSQGTGVTHEGEIKQGKDMIDAAVQAGVKHFVYSSVDRGGNEKSWETPTPIPHFSSKYEIERHLRANAGDMGWTVLRPTAFMDNLQPDFPTQVFIAAMRDTCKSKPVQWVACRDIGVFVKKALDTPQEYNQKALSLAGQQLTVKELDEVFRNKTTQGMIGTYGIFGSLLKLIIGEVKLMINWFASDGYGADISALKKHHPGLMDFSTWIEQESKFVMK